MVTSSVHYSSKTIEWGTPPEILAMVADMGYRIVLDVCATPGRQVCDTYFSPPSSSAIEPCSSRDLGSVAPAAYDGLSQPWRVVFGLPEGSVAWCNPPYGREIGRWVAKAASEARDRGVTSVCLLPARTDTTWWHDYCQPILEGDRPGHVKFLKGRVRFISPDGGRRTSAPFPSVLVVFGDAK